MNGNLCRCMAYVRIKQAIKLAASRMHGASRMGRCVGGLRGRAVGPPPEAPAC